MSSLDTTPESVVEAYISRHGQKAVREKFAADAASMCQRSYVIASLRCPQQFGNVFGEFLNNIAAAIITDHTVLIGYEDDRGDCSQYLQSAGDFLTVEEADELHSHANCRRPELEKCFGFLDFKDGAADQNCAGVSFQVKFEHQQMAQMANNSNLGPVSQEVARSLFAEGPYRGFHAIFERAVKFTDIVASNVTNVMERTEHTYRIGAHVRHLCGCSSPDRCTKFDTSVIKCIKALASNSSQSRCSVLLATDWEPSIDHIMDGFNRMDNSLDSFTHKLHVCTESFRHHMLEIEKATGCRTVSTMISDHPVTEAGLIPWDHGPFTGQIAMMDIYMLSHADALALTPFSSFSERVGELFASSPERASRIYETRACAPTTYNIHGAV